LQKAGQHLRSLKSLPVDSPEKAVRASIVSDQGKGTSGSTFS
jgi:hypothetical protein